MTFPRLRVWSILPLALLVAGMAGCSPPETVQVKDEPKDKSPTATPVPENQKQYRTLGAIYPADGTPQEGSATWWFIKFSGPRDVVDKYEADVRKIIESARTTQDKEKPITWTLPAGWKEEEGSMMRYATLKSPDGKAEVSVSRAGGTLLANVNRWWVQLWGKERPDDITGATLNDYAKRTEIRGRLVFIVDLAGPNNPSAGGRPMMMPPGHGALPPGHP